jgi:hypothetical protein
MISRCFLIFDGKEIFSWPSICGLWTFANCACYQLKRWLRRKTKFPSIYVGCDFFTASKNDGIHVKWFASKWERMCINRLDLTDVDRYVSIVNIWLSFHYSYCSTLSIVFYFSFDRMISRDSCVPFSFLLLLLLLSLSNNDNSMPINRSIGRLTKSYLVAALFCIRLCSIIMDWFEKNNRIQTNAKLLYGVLYWSWLVFVDVSIVDISGTHSIGLTLMSTSVLTREKNQWKKSREAKHNVSTIDC